MSDILNTHLQKSEDNVSEGINNIPKTTSFKDKVENLSKSLLDDIESINQHRDARKVAKDIHHIGDLDVVYLKYEKDFADTIARYAIKQIVDHEIEYGHYEYLHNLLSNKYLNEQERHRIEKNINKAALNYVKRHNGSFLKTKVEGTKESLYDFQQLVNILYTEYISEEIKKKAENVILKRIKNKNEFGKNLFFVKNNKNLAANMRQIASKTLEDHEKIGLGKYQKR